MNAFRLYVDFTHSTATVNIQRETLALLYLCRKALTPLLHLSLSPTASEHCSCERFTEQLWWRTSFILEYLGIWTPLSEKNTRSTARRDWKMEAGGRQKKESIVFPSLCFHTTFPSQINNTNHIKCSSSLSLSHFFILPSTWAQLTERKLKLHLLQPL